MSADEKFDFINKAEYQYGKYCMVVLRKKRLNESEIETMMEALEVDEGFKDGVQYLLKKGSAGFGDSCAFSRALEANWKKISFQIPEGKEQEIRRIAEMNIYDYLELIRIAPEFAFYQYCQLGAILGSNGSYCGPAENPFAIEVPDLLRNGTMLFETEKIPRTIANVELFSETLLATWQEIQVIGETRKRLEEIATMTVDQYRSRILPEKAEQANYQISALAEIVGVQPEPMSEERFSDYARLFNLPQELEKRLVAYLNLKEFAKRCPKGFMVVIESYLAAEVFSSSFRRMWQQIPVREDAKKILEEIAEMTLAQYQRRK